jgi:two-component system chemotaxis response regulator CheB
MAHLSESGTNGQRRIVVVGGSAGSLAPLRALLRGLDPDLPATVLVVQHGGSGGSGHLPDVLRRESRLPVAYATDGEFLHSGTVRLAPPGRHLLIHDGIVRLVAGPRINLVRPAVDALFRSAARWCGPATAAVVLSGALDDGAAGAASIAARGGPSWRRTPVTPPFRVCPRQRSLRFRTLDPAPWPIWPGLSPRPSASPLPSRWTSHRPRSSGRRI